MSIVQFQANQTHLQSPFDSIKQVDDKGFDYWIARDLMPLMAYSRWSDFKPVVERAMVACTNTGNSVPEHFTGLTLKSNGRPMQDFKLSRYAAYLVAMNGDPRKNEVAAAQSYFAIKTHIAEQVENVAPQLTSAKEDALNDLSFFNEAAQILIDAGVDKLLVAGHVLNQCAQWHPRFSAHFESLGKLLPQQKSLQSDEILLTPTAVGEKFDPPIKPRQVNKILLDLELQQLTGESQPRYKLTDKGKTFGKVVLNQGKNAGKTVQQVLWYPSVVDAIEEAI